MTVARVFLTWNFGFSISLISLSLTIKSCLSDHLPLLDALKANDVFIVYLVCGFVKYNLCMWWYGWLCNDVNSRFTDTRHLTKT